jgi:hypothetical protein
VRNRVVRGDAGLTVVEMAVTLLILSIVSIVLFDFVNNVTMVTARTDRHVRAEQDGQFALRRMTQEMRAANPILNAGGCTTGTLSGYGDCVSFDLARATNLDQPCVRRTITYKLDRPGRRVTREQKDWTWNGTTCIAGATSGPAPIITNVVNSGAVFTYQNAKGQALSDVALIPMAPKQNGTASVAVSLSIRYQARNTPDLNLSSTAVLRNNR